MRFVPSRQLEAPSYLYQHTDRSIGTIMRPAYKHEFEHSASSCFFAYIPLYFWRQVVHQTNKHAVVNIIRTAPFTLHELKTFLGIMFFMAMNDKGEFANYWGPQPENHILGENTTSLDGIMTLTRFKLLRRCLSFNASHTTLDGDAAAWIWPLLNLLKITGGQYVHVWRNVALDGANVACCSRQGRHMIAYDPMKPTGKFFSGLHMVCWATKWIALNYKLHCNKRGILDHLIRVVGQGEAQQLDESVSKIRQHVLETVRPRCGSNRIVNMNNYYTSVQLLQELRLKGLYGRGTIRANSKHYPSHTILHKEGCSRGGYQQAVSHDHSMLAASWCDGNVVNMVTNADSSDIISVTRMVSWLGLANYLHKYSKNYAEVARPLFNLLKKDVDWCWDTGHQAAFESIKEGLLQAPILVLSNPDRSFSVVCDASDFAIGRALLQADAEGRERMVAFESRQLKAAGKNYPVHDKELLALKYALVKFRVHLLGSKPFVIYTDHASLRTATQSSHLSQRMARWLSFFTEYNFEVKFQPGSQNVRADAVSRRPDYKFAHVTTMTSSVTDLIHTAYARDDSCVALLHALGSVEFTSSDIKLSARLRARLHRYILDDGLLFYGTDPKDTPRVVVLHDEDLKYRILYEAHNTPLVAISAARRSTAR